MRRDPTTHRTSPSRQGMTLVEVMVAVVILTLSTWMLSSTITAAVAHSDGKRERALAVEAAMNALERMHAEPFEDVFALFDEDPSDDPDGEGTGPGCHFQVPGLEPLPDDVDGCVGRVILPAPGPELLETSEVTFLDMPRDLNGDLMIDSKDHAGDYMLLPVQVRLDWQGSGGPRTFTMSTILCAMGKVVK